jgi:hypothetical protein
MRNKPYFKVLTAVAFAAHLASCANMNTGDPVAIAEGLIENSDSKFSEFHQRPNADLSRFTTFKLEPCVVTFKEDWMRRQNDNRVEPSNRVKQEDADKITRELSALCNEKFLTALQKKPAYTLVNEGGAATLLLRPAIVDLDVHAPDIRSASLRRTFTQSSGEMTLNLDFIDASSGELVARAVDKRRGMDGGYLERTTSVSNKADAGIALLRWGNLLRDTLQTTP